MFPLATVVPHSDGTASVRFGVKEPQTFPTTREAFQHARKVTPYVTIHRSAAGNRAYVR